MPLHAFANSPSHPRLTISDYFFPSKRTHTHPPTNSHPHTHPSRTYTMCTRRVMYLNNLDDNGQVDATVLRWWRKMLKKEKRSFACSSAKQQREGAGNTRVIVIIIVPVMADGGRAKGVRKETELRARMPQTLIIIVYKTGAIRCTITHIVARALCLSDMREKCRRKNRTEKSETPKRKLKINLSKTGKKKELRRVVACAASSIKPHKTKFHDLRCRRRGGAIF